MKDEKKTKAQLIEELVELRERMGEWEVVGKRQQVLSRVREEVWKMEDPKDMDEVLIAIRKGLEVLGIPFQDCDVNVIDPSDPSWVRFSTMTPQEEWIEAGTERGAGIIHHIWQEGKVAYRRDLTTEDIYQESPQLERIFGHAVRSVIDIPFSHGTLAVNSLEANAFSEPHIRDLQSLAEVLSEGFQRLEDLQELEERNRELEAEITEGKQTEEALKKSEGTKKAFLNAFTDVAALFDPQGFILDINEAMAQRLGKRVDELIGMCGWDLVPPEVAESRKAYVDQVIQSGRFIRFEDERQGIWFDNVFSPVFDAQGKVTSIVLLARDITERKQAEEALQESEDKYRRRIQLASAIFWFRVHFPFPATTLHRVNESPKPSGVDD